MIYRNITRVLKNTTEITEQAKTPAATTVALALLTTDALYLGYHEKFTQRYFHFSTLNTTAATLTVEYWTGTVWAAIEDKVDQTSGFTVSGFVSWKNKSDWKTQKLTPVTNVDLYWIRIKVSANLSAGTILQAVLNLFCDEALLRAYYPEVVSDSRYKPPSRTDWLEQLQAGKDLVVTRLKQLRAIKDESQILDINEVAVAAVHATMYIILNGIPAQDDEQRKARDDAYDAMTEELNLARHSFDADNDGGIDDQEKEMGTTFVARN